MDYIITVAGLIEFIEINKSNFYNDFNNNSISGILSYLNRLDPRKQLSYLNSNYFDLFIKSWNGKIKIEVGDADMCSESFRLITSSRHIRAFLEK